MEPLRARGSTSPASDLDRDRGRPSHGERDVGTSSPDPFGRDLRPSSSSSSSSSSSTALKRRRYDDHGSDEDEEHHHGRHHRRRLHDDMDGADDDDHHDHRRGGPEYDYRARSGTGSGGGGDPRARGTPVGSFMRDERETSWSGGSGSGSRGRGDYDHRERRDGRDQGRRSPPYSGEHHHDRHASMEHGSPYYAAHGGDYDRGRSPPGHRGRRDEGYRGRSPPPGRDMFGRDWPPPGRDGRDPYGGSSRRSFPPSDRSGRGGDWSRSSSHRSEDREWDHREESHTDKDRRSSKENDLYSQPLKSYKQWLELQDDGILPQEASRRYDDYKNEYTKKLSHNFFLAHKEEDWFKEKYHPDLLDKKRQEMTALAQRNYATFVVEYEEGRIDVNSVESDLYYSEEANRKRKESQNKPNRRSADEMEEKDEDEERQKRENDAEAEVQELDASNSYDIVLDHLLDAKRHNAASQKEVEPPRDPNCLYIKYIPAKGSKEELLTLFEQVEGFVKLITSEPKKFQNFQRVGWVIYNNPDSCRSALNRFNGQRLKDYDLQLGPAKVLKGAGRDRVRIAPPAADEDSRVMKDAVTSKKIVSVLDKEREMDSRGILDSPSDNDEDAGTARAQLNRYITYLRRVHLFCFYCAEQFDSEEELHRACGEKQHLRARRRADHEATPEEVSWLTYLDSKLEQRLAASSPDTYTAKTAVERELENFYESKIKQEDEKKFRCTIPKCNKLFMSPEFIKKHLKLKHQELIDRIRERVIEEQYFKNYLDDPRRILPSMPEVRLPARPERGGERERRGVESDRYGYGVPHEPPYGGPGVIGGKPPLLGRVIPPPPIQIGPPMHRGAFFSPRIAMPGVAPFVPPVYAPYVRPVMAPLVQRGRGGFGGSRGGRFGGTPHRPGYVDLDAPPEDGSLGEHRTTIDYGDLDAVPEPPPSIALDTSTSSVVTAGSGGSSTSPSKTSSTEADGESPSVEQ